MNNAGMKPSSKLVAMTSPPPSRLRPLCGSAHQRKEPAHRRPQGEDSATSSNTPIPSSPYDRAGRCRQDDQGTGPDAGQGGPARPATTAREYFWLNDHQPTSVMHPIKPELEGKDMSDVKDPTGKFLYKEFRQGRQSRRGPASGTTCGASRG